MFKKVIILLVVCVSFFIPKHIYADEGRVNLYLFWSRTCPHCAREKAFLEKISPDYPYLKIYKFEISDRQNANLMKKVGESMEIDTSGVPLTLIGNYNISGYFNDEITGKQILSYVEELKEKGDPDTVGLIISENSIKPENQNSPTIPPLESEKNVSQSENKIPDQLPIPIIGNINTKDVSLPLLTILIAAIDGFNPCAMWTLLFLISLLLGMKDKKRMWILGGAFIVSSAAVYFLFLSAWLNLFLFLGFIVWVRTAIGIIALGSGGYYLYDFAKNKSGGCSVTGDPKRKKIFEKLKSITQRKEFLLALIGIITLAFAVNLVELICSAGLPAIYTQVLSLADLPRWQYYLYLLLYILVFMFDDLFIFFTAMLTLQITGIQSKYSRYSHLIGGILMAIIGLLMLFKPELLMFS